MFLQKTSLALKNRNEENINDPMKPTETLLGDIRHQWKHDLERSDGSACSSNPFVESDRETMKPNLEKSATRYMLMSNICDNCSVPANEHATMSTSGHSRRWLK